MSGIRLAMLALAALALLAAATLYAYRRRRPPLGVDSRTFTAIDTDTGGSGALLLREPGLGLCGKPDYLLEGDGDGRRVLAPLEVKPGRRSLRLYDSDRIQVGAYLVALRGTFPNARPVWGSCNTPSEHSTSFSRPISPPKSPRSWRLCAAREPHC